MPAWCIQGEHELPPEVIYSQKCSINICLILKIYKLIMASIRKYVTKYLNKVLLLNIVRMFRKTTVVLNKHSGTPVD